MSYKFYNAFAFIVVTILLLIMAFSCKTVKEVIKVQTKYDSTAIAEVQHLTKVLRETKEEHQRIIQELSTTGIYFDTVYLPGDTTKLPARIIIDKNGRIQAEGKLSKVLLTNQKYSQEIDLLGRIVDSLTMEDQKKKTELSKKESVVVKEKKQTVLPGWIWFLLLAGWIGRGYWPRLKKYLSLIKL